MVFYDTSKEHLNYILKGEYVPKQTRSYSNVSF
jgi:hypothetical protein